MSSADSRPPEMPNTASDGNPDDASAAADSNRPALKQPPRRPVKPEPPVEKPIEEPVEKIVEPPAAVEVVEVVKAVKVKETTAADAAADAAASAAEPTEPVESTDVTTGESESEGAAPEAPPEPQPRLQPIAPPSEPMQYRAIGLLKGRYEPSEESFNRGNIVNHDGTTTCAVLLGRTTSLVKKHLDLEKDHLWVVYPRTIFQDDIGIAVQIVGVWEPETLGEEDDETIAAPEDAIQPDYFSIRGEVVKFDERKQEITVSIVQKMRTGKQPKRPFKLVINGSIGVKTIGYFWDMHVHREGNQFVLNEGSYVAAVPPKKRSKRRPGGSSGGGGGGKRRPPAKRSGAPRPKPNLAKGDGGEKPNVVKVGDSSSAVPDTDSSQED
ncbi:hypothetical protein [Leptothoe spongobia]|uniref:Uncharacterized protein n=1 Tax=Leptothoe spongobia TAU-MAC 1115 TaxID=1967444 RepID=A0A947DI33_9CYAN|nr:hypothetical protein [Leptothoe spongobia]MBT9316356.1 hypothetical protein [Leptothoe spongobia TAU-MAC 1115]